MERKKFLEIKVFPNSIQIFPFRTIFDEFHTRYENDTPD